MPDPATLAVIIITGSLLLGHGLACIHERRRLRKECDELKRMYGAGFSDWWNRR